MPNTAGSRLPVVILISGTGSNMQVIAEQAASGRLPLDVRAVISDRTNAGGLNIAGSMGIAQEVLDPRQFTNRDEFDTALASVVERYQPELIVLAGFMRILGPQFTGRFPGRMLNIHPSLLPKYRGLHTHRRALEAGDTEHGASVHFVTQELDGGPVALQARVPVLPGDTESTLAARVLEQEHRLYPEALRLLAEGRLKYSEGKLTLDGRELHGPAVLDPAGAN